MQNEGGFYASKKHGSMTHEVLEKARLICDEKFRPVVTSGDGSGVAGTGKRQREYSGGDGDVLGLDSRLCCICYNLSEGTHD